MERLDKMSYWRRIWLYWLATLRLDSYAVCVMSQNKGFIDYHDYPDSTLGEPAHFSRRTCKRCKKEFMI